MDIDKSLKKFHKESRTLLSIERWLVKKYLDFHFPRGGIVIGGCGRSGTSLLLGMLSAHSRIYTINEETWSLYPYINPIKFLIKLRPWAINKRNCRWCEKTPKNVVNIDEILSFIGSKGKFLHIVRDGRDVITSLHPHNRSKYWVSIERWINDVSMGLIAEKHPQVMRISYENLVQAQRNALTNVLNFLDEEFEDVILEWEKKGKIKSHTAWHGRATKTHTNSIGRWKEPEHSKRIEEFMKNEKACLLLHKLGYL
ncbi:sulfotransferase [Thermodesulfobacteriota bacterium]